jgi:hypothetical protein
VDCEADIGMDSPGETVANVHSHDGMVLAIPKMMNFCENVHMQCHVI